MSTMMSYQYRVHQIHTAYSEWEESAIVRENALQAERAILDIKEKEINRYLTDVDNFYPAFIEKTRELAAFRSITIRTYIIHLLNIVSAGIEAFAIEVVSFDLRRRTWVSDVECLKMERESRRKEYQKVIDNLGVEMGYI